MIINQFDLDSILLQIIADVKKYDIYSFILFDSLYNTGLRVNELIDYSRITQIDINTVLVTTQKHSNPRAINTSLLNSTYFEALKNNSLKLFIRSYSYYNSSFITRCRYYKDLKIGDKQVTTHLFRHNYIKKLALNGFTCNQISAIIGERVDTNTQSYIDSIITAT